MLQDNVELVLDIYASWQVGNFAKTDWAAPNMEFRAIESSPDAEADHGVEDMRRLWRSFLSQWESLRRLHSDARC